MNQVERAIGIDWRATLNISFHHRFSNSSLARRGQNLRDLSWL